MVHLCILLQSIMFVWCEAYSFACSLSSLGAMRSWMLAFSLYIFVSLLILWLRRELLELVLATWELYMHSWTKNACFMHGSGSLYFSLWLTNHYLLYLILDWLLLGYQDEFSVVQWYSGWTAWSAVSVDWTHFFFTDIYRLVEVDAVVICGSHFLPTMELGV